MAKKGVPSAEAKLLAGLGFSPASPRRRRPREWGLVLSAHHGSVDVEIDEGSDQPAWRATIATASAEVTIDLDGLDAVVRLDRLLSATAAARDRPTPDVTVGTSNGVPATFIRDVEFPDRAFLLVGRATSVSVRLTFAGTDYHDLHAAVAAVGKRLPVSGVMVVEREMTARPVPLVTPSSTAL